MSLCRWYVYVSAATVNELDQSMMISFLDIQEANMRGTGRMIEDMGLVHSICPMEIITKALLKMMNSLVASITTIPLPIMKGSSSKIVLMAKANYTYP